MATPFDNLLAATKKYSSEKELKSLIVSGLEPFEPEIIDLNQKQLEEGKLSTGQNTGEYESKEYATFKKSIGSKSSPNADLKLTGDFFEGFDVDFESERLIINSKDDKTQKLENKYSIDIFGLNDDNKKQVLEMAMPEVINKINNDFTR